MDPKTPTEFLSKASNAIDPMRRTNQRIRLNRDTVLLHDMQNPLKVAIRITYQQKNGYQNKKNDCQVITVTTKNVREK